jgi:hypothetical protein
MRVAIRGLVAASVGAALTALYLFLLAPRLLDPENMAAPLLFVSLPLFFIHALLLATVCGSLVCASRALCTERSWRAPAGYTVFTISLVATAVLAYLYVYRPCSWPLRDCHQII